MRLVSLHVNFFDALQIEIRDLVMALETVQRKCCKQCLFSKGRFTHDNAKMVFSVQEAKYVIDLIKATYP